MPNQALTLIVRMWLASDGSIKASVKPAEGGEVRHFADLQGLIAYLEQARPPAPTPSSQEPQGLR
ncbi:MAG: hypothetical protein SFU83_12075 [Meiothermus sp.]|nr:hypothetical protein [Meiothermus sp.]